ncbi:MAG: superinfection immunity protein [Pirellulaceae bacterium]|nr:superinfection immunity protein [Pirellulaceae bacterium]
MNKAGSVPKTAQSKPAPQPAIKSSPPEGTSTAAQPAAQSHSKIEKIQGLGAALVSRSITAKWTRPKVLVAVLTIIYLAIVIITTSVSLVGVVMSLVSEGEMPQDVYWWQFFTLPIVCLVLMIGISLYAMPTIVAFLRYHKNVIPILIVNVCFGWTFLGWVLSLVWSFTDHTKFSEDANRAHIHTHVYTQDNAK